MLSFAARFSFLVLFVMSKYYKSLILGFVSVAVVSIPGSSMAIAPEDVLNPRRTNGSWVADEANVLSPETEANLNQQIHRLERKNGTEIAVVTLPTTVPAPSTRAFALELFNYWGIGKAYKNNGVLLLVSVQQRRVEIITGVGIEARISDRKAQQIINTTITPWYKQGDYNRGTLEGIDKIASILDLHPFWQWLTFGTSEINPQELHPFWKWFTFSTLGIAVLWRWERRHRGETNKILLKTGSVTRFKQRERYRRIYCAHCRQLMTRAAIPKLTKAQKIAKKIGSTKYIGCRCLNCDPEEVFLISYESQSSRFGTCPRCQVATLITTRKIIKDFLYRDEKVRYRQKCQCCDYQNEYTKKISRRTVRHTHSDHDYDYSSYDSYSGGYDSGGSDFGGGYSDDGGAGGDF